MQVKFTLGIPEALRNQLDRLVEATGKTRNALVREGVEHVIEKYEVR